MIYVPIRAICSHALRLLRVGGSASVDAKIYTTRHGYALDTFQVMDIGSVPHPRDMIAQIESELADWLANQVRCRSLSGAGIATRQALSIAPECTSSR